MARSASGAPREWGDVSVVVHAARLRASASCVPTAAMVFFRLPCSPRGVQIRLGCPSAQFLGPYYGSDEKPDRPDGAALGTLPL